MQVIRNDHADDQSCMATIFCVNDKYAAQIIILSDRHMFTIPC